MEPVLPEPDITIIIEENTTEPFDYIAQEMRLWLANHNDKEDILVGDHANNETIEDYDALKQLGPHPLLERQMKRHAPLRWMHVKLQLAGNADCWLRLVLRADNLYMKGFANLRNGLSLSCYEITEEPVQGKVSRNRCRLFPQEYNALPLPWDLKYYEMLECDLDPDLIIQRVREMWDDPAFMTNAVQFFSFHDPTVGNPREAKGMLAGITFKLCEFLRMRLTFDTPNLMDKVWGWGDVCKELKKWKKNRYDCNGWNNISLKEMGIMGPRDALELVLLVLNQTHGAFLYAEGMKAKMEKNQNDRSNDSHSPEKQDNKGFGAPKRHGSKASGASTNKDGCSDCGTNKSFSRVPFGRCRIQILSIRANFEIDDINVYDWHRGQKIYMNTSGYIDQEAGMTGLVLCGPRRAIGAYGYLGIEIFPTESIMDPATKKRRTATGARELLSESWDVSEYDDAQPSKHMKVVCGSSDRRVEVSYLHIPNTIEAEVKVQMYSDGSTEISGFIKATATGYGRSYVELFRKENEETQCVRSGEWTIVPLLVKVLCLPYRSDLQLTVDIDLKIVQPGRRYSRLSTHTFSTKYGKQEVEFDGNKIEVIVTMHPDLLT